MNTTSLGWIAIGALIGILIVAVAVRPWRRTVDRTVTVDGADVLRREIERARRYGRQFAVIRFGQQTCAGSPSEMLRRMTAQLRDLDYAWIEESRVHALLPECDRAAALGCLDRILPELDIVDAGDISVTVFPDDTVTEGGVGLHLDGDRTLPDSVDLPSVGPYPRAVDDIKRAS